MTKEFIYNFILQRKLAVLSTVSSEHIPESALVGIAAAPDLKIIFDTVSDFRKCKNLMLNSNISFVIGWDNKQTIQYKGIAKIPENAELEDLLQIYFDVFPDGRDRRQNWKNIVYFCVEPKWIRYSNFNKATHHIDEMRF